MNHVCAFCGFSKGIQQVDDIRLEGGRARRQDVNCFTIYYGCNKTHYGLWLTTGGCTCT